MTREEARWAAKGHVIRVIEGALAEGWPDPEEFGYTEDDAKKPPHRSWTVQPWHSSRYSFFQSEMLFRATGQSCRSRTHSWWL